MPCSFSKHFKERLRNSRPLSVCNVVGATSVNSPRNAVTNDDVDFVFGGAHPTHFKKTSVTVKRNVVPSLSFFQIRYVDEISLPLVIASDDASCLKSGAHRFVQGVRVLFQKTVIDGFRRCASEASQYAARFGDGPQVTGESTAHVVGIVVGATLRQQQFGLVPEVIVPMFRGHVYFTLLLFMSISYVLLTKTSS